MPKPQHIWERTVECHRGTLYLRSYAARHRPRNFFESTEYMTIAAIDCKALKNPLTNPRVRNRDITHIDNIMTALDSVRACRLFCRSLMLCKTAHKQMPITTATPLEVVFYCTSGKHRSKAMVEAIFLRLVDQYGWVEVPETQTTHNS